jgi:rubrerythrin
LEKQLQVLEYAIKMEIEGHDFYKNLASKGKNKRIQNIFAGLAEMELEHYELLKKQKDLIAEGQSFQVVDIKSMREKDFFKERLDKELSDMETGLGDISVIRMAYLIENDLAEFYKKAAKNTEDPAGKKMYEELADWEEEHRRILYQEYQSYTQENWFDMGFSPF